jgi:RNA polymerase sigma factor (sigma-70 family)
MQVIENYYKESYIRKVKLVSRILRGDYASAEDVVQEAFARALRFYPSYDEKRGTFDKWFNSIMFNAMHNMQNDHKGIVHEISDKISPQDVIEEDQLANVPDLNNYIARCIKEIENDSHRRILELFFIMGYTSKEISQIEHKITQTNVTTVVMRFRDKLKGVK